MVRVLRAGWYNIDGGSKAGIDVAMYNVGCR